MPNPLRATKAFRYGTRRLSPGDLFEAGDRDTRLLTAIGKAERTDVAPRGALDAPPASLLSQLDHDQNGKPGGSASPAPADDLTALRKQYREVKGKQAFNGWDADTLRAKIAEGPDA